MGQIQFPTQPQLKYNFQAYLQGENSDIDAFATNGSWDILAGAQSLTFLDLYANLQLVANSQYPQYSAGAQVDWGLYARGLPGRGTNTYAIIICIYNGTTPTAIPFGTTFTSSETGAIFVALSDINITSGSTQFALYSNTPGSGYLESVGNTLTGNNDQTVGVISSTDGQNKESDQSCIGRILAYDRTPTAGSRETDYQNYALQYNQTLTNPVITDSIPIINFTTINNVSVFGLFAVGGNSQISEYQLNQGLLSGTNYIGYSRQIDSNTVTGLNNYIQSLRLVGLGIIVGTSVTQTVTSPTSQLNLTVSLVTGYQLSTLITVNSQDQLNNPITVQLTVQQLIQREVRRAICNQPYGGTVINDKNYITMNSIRFAVNSQLSATSGSIAQLVTNLTITNNDIVVPTAGSNTTNINYTYDIDSYQDVLVSQV